MGDDDPAVTGLDPPLDRLGQCREVVAFEADARDRGEIDAVDRPGINRGEKPFGVGAWHRAVGPAGEGDGPAHGDEKSPLVGGAHSSGWYLNQTDKGL